MMLIKHGPLIPNSQWPFVCCMKLHPSILYRTIHSSVFLLQIENPRLLSSCIKRKAYSGLLEMQTME